MADADKFPHLYSPDSEGNFIFEKPGWNDDLEHISRSSLDELDGDKIQEYSDEAMKTLESYFLLRNLAEKARQYTPHPDLSPREIAAIEFARDQLYRLLSKSNVNLNEQEEEFNDSDDFAFDEHADLTGIDLEDDEIPF